MKNSTLDKNVKKLNAIVKTVAQARNVHVIDSAKALSPDGKFVSRLLDRNKSVSVRSNDGVHISGDGGEILSDYIYAVLNNLYDFEKFAVESTIKPVKIFGCCKMPNSTTTFSSTKKSSQSTRSTTSSSSTSSAPTSSSTSTSTTAVAVGNE